jgi:hypothetical protein
MSDKLNEQPYFPYPRDGLTRFGFIIGDIIALSVMVLIVYAVAQNFLR